MVTTRRPSLTDEQQAIVNAAGIPVDSAYPSTYWIGSLNYETVMPTAAELRMIRSYIEYTVRRRYSEHYQELIFAKPFPALGGHVTKVFRKGALWLSQPDPEEGWCYRHGNWENHGTWPDGLLRFSLEAVLNRLNSTVWDANPRVFPEWTTWKAEHPDAFPV